MMKYFFFFFLFGMFCITTQAQFADRNYYLVDSLQLDALGPDDRSDIESFLKEYHASKIDSVQLKALAHLALLQDFNTWVKYNRILFKRTKKIIDSKKKHSITDKLLYRLYGHALYGRGYYYSEINNEDSCQYYTRLSIPAYKKAKSEKNIASAWNAIGISLYRQGKIEASLAYYQKAVDIFEKLDNKKGIAATSNSIGTVYKSLNEFDKAKIYYEKALKIYEVEGSLGDQADIWNMLGINYKWSKDTLAAEKAYENSLRLSREAHYDYGIATALLNLGLIYQERGEFEKAIFNYSESLKEFKLIQAENGISYALNNMATLLVKMKRPREALKYAEEAHTISEKLGYPESLLNTSSVLLDIYEELEMYKEALKMKGIYWEMKDSIAGLETQKTALKAQLQYENEREVLLLQKKQEEKNLVATKEKEQQRIIIVSVVICLAIVILFSFYLFNRFRVIRKQKKIIEAQKEIVEEKNKEITDSINYAKRLQEAILPPQKLVKEYLPESFILYKPKDIVAGDFYWLETVQSGNNELILFAVADCTGHGVPGAMVSVVCANALNRAVKEFALTDPGKILDKVRLLVIETFEKSESEVKDGMDISLCCLETNKDSKMTRLKWAGANNPLWIHEKFSNAIRETRADKQPIGKYTDPKPFTTHAFDLNQGDTIYIFTDGYADQFGGQKGKKFKGANLQKLLIEVAEKKPEMQKDLVNKSFENWKANLEQIDDVCIIGVRI